LRNWMALFMVAGTGGCGLWTVVVRKCDYLLVLWA